MPILHIDSDALCLSEARWETDVLFCLQAERCWCRMALDFKCGFTDILHILRVCKQLVTYTNSLKTHTIISVLTYGNINVIHLYTLQLMIPLKQRRVHPVSSGQRTFPRPGKTTELEVTPRWGKRWRWSHDKDYHVGLIQYFLSRR